MKFEIGKRDVQVCGVLYLVCASAAFVLMWIGFWYSVPWITITQDLLPEEHVRCDELNSTNSNGRALDVYCAKETHDKTNLTCHCTQISADFGLWEPCLMPTRRTLNTTDETKTVNPSCKVQAQQFVAATFVLSAVFQCVAMLMVIAGMRESVGRISVMHVKKAALIVQTIASFLAVLTFTIPLGNVLSNNGNQFFADLKWGWGIAVAYWVATSFATFLLAITYSFSTHVPEYLKMGKRSVTNVAPATLLGSLEYGAFVFSGVAFVLIWIGNWKPVPWRRLVVDFRNPPFNVDSNEFNCTSGLAQNGLQQYCSWPVERALGCDCLEYTFVASLWSYCLTVAESLGDITCDAGVQQLSAFVQAMVVLSCICQCAAFFFLLVIVGLGKKLFKITDRTRVILALSLTTISAFFSLLAWGIVYGKVESVSPVAGAFQNNYDWGWIIQICYFIASFVSLMFLFISYVVMDEEEKQSDLKQPQSAPANVETPAPAEGTKPTDEAAAAAAEAPAEEEKKAEQADDAVTLEIEDKTAAKA